MQGDISQGFSKIMFLNVFFEINIKKFKLIYCIVYTIQLQWHIKMPLVHKSLIRIHDVIFLKGLSHDIESSFDDYTGKSIFVGY